jgi:S-adenosylmethionine-diacylglycerol 3-amino-3-carboxypropyl transferase
MVATLARPMHMPTPPTPPDSELFYAHTREDPMLELELVERLARERGRPLRVAVVASGGCTALTLLSSPDVARVDAIDLNPAQLHLTELKRACIDGLNLGEQRRLFGADEASSPDRLALYDRVRSDLSPAAREHWDARPEEIAFGLGHVARFERMCNELAGAFYEEGLNPADRPSEALGHPSWNGIFGRVFDNGRYASEFGTASIAYSNQRPMWQHFSTSFAEALKRSRAQDNYFLAQVFHTGDGASPPCLEPDVQQAIRKHGTHRLHLHRGPLLGRLEALGAQGKYDLVQTSDVTDWLPPEERRALMRTVASVLDDDGVVIARRMTADKELAPAVAAHLEIDAETSARFTAHERTYLYPEVVVASRPA